MAASVGSLKDWNQIRLVNHSQSLYDYMPVHPKYCPILVLDKSYLIQYNYFNIK